MARNGALLEAKLAALNWEGGLLQCLGLQALPRLGDPLHAIVPGCQRLAGGAA